MNADERFERDVPVEMREDVLQRIEEAAWDLGHKDKAITIWDRDHIDAVNLRAHGVIEIDGNEHVFILESGNWNGTVLLSWDDDKQFEHHQPTQWALQPARHLVDDAIAKRQGPFLVLKWDAVLRNLPKVAEIPRSFAYDRFVQPGGFVTSHWKNKAAQHSFEIVTKEEADETRTRLQAAGSDAT